LNAKSATSHRKTNQRQSRIEEKVFFPTRFSDDIDDCCLDEEKEDGWIDFDAMTSKRSPMKDSYNNTTERDQGCETTARFLLKSTTMQNGGEATDRAMSFSNNDFAEFPIARRKLIVKPPPIESDTTHDVNVKGQSEKQTEKVSSWNESPSRASSQKRHLANLYKKSLEYKYYPKIFKGLTALLYLSLFAFLLSQILMRVIVNDNVNDFKAQKDILRNFQKRNFFLITSEGLIRFLFDVQVGNFNITGVPAFANGVGNWVTISKYFMKGLNEANKQLLTNAGQFDDEINNLLFTKDIPLYYTYFNEYPQSFTQETSFGAVDRIYSAMIQVRSYEGTDAEPIKETAQFVFRNSLNDVIVKNQAISAIISGSLKGQRNKISRSVEYYCITMIVIEFVIFVVLAFYLWKQYVKETKNLSAFCRVNNQKVNEVLKNCISFKEMVEEQKSFSAGISSLAGGNSHKKGKTEEEPAKREANKSPEHTGLRRKYYIYSGIYFVFVSALIGLGVLGAYMTSGLLTAFKKEQDQIYFIDYMRTRIVLSLQAARELLATNNTAMIENRSAYDEYYYLLDELKTVKSQIYEKLLNDETIDKLPDVKTMLLGDACSLITEPVAQVYCTLMRKQDAETGLVYVLAKYEGILNDYLNAYEASDKSASALADVQKTVYTTVTGPYGVLIYGAITLSDMIDDRLEVQIKANKNDQEFFFVYCSILCGGIAGLLWVWILRKLKEGINQFKNVLMTLPADVVLSSFILKTFLKKTSKSGFDSFKN